MKRKQRLDMEMVERGLAESRSRAQALILAGAVLVDGEKAQKAGLVVDGETNIELAEQLPYVSRGGLKLEKALDEFSIDPQGRVAVDVGASTGGFTDCLLQRGASLVYAVDVGYGQLAWSLRQNPKVVCLEKTNARYLKPEMFPQKPNLATVDVSFISLKLVLPPLIQCLLPGWDLVTLIKPQFEAGREQVGKHGVIRDPKVQLEVLKSLYNFGVEQGCPWQNLTYSPVLGPEGNIEFLAHWAVGGTPLDEAVLEEVVAGAYRQLKKKE